MTEVQENPSSFPAGTPVVIDEQPMVFWDRDDARTQVEFLRSIDPTYFVYLAAIHEAQLEGENDLSAAVALRVTYSHVLESLFAFIGAAVQSPHCPAGWLLKYKFTDLKGFVEKISDRKPLHNKLNLDRPGWREVASALLPWGTTDDDGEERRDASAKLWKSLARDMLDESFNGEYNSLKHGCRIRSGEWFLNIGAESTPGTPPPPDRMRQLGASRYGSTFLRALPLQKHYWGLEEQRVNWNPVTFARRIPLITDSLYNVLTFLKVQNGVSTEELELAFFDQAAVSEALSDSNPSGVTRFAVRHRIDPRTLPSLSKEGILDLYSETSEPSSGPQEKEPSKSTPP